MESRVLANGSPTAIRRSRKILPALLHDGQLIFPEFPADRLEQLARAPDPDVPDELRKKRPGQRLFAGGRQLISERRQSTASAPLQSGDLRRRQFAAPEPDPRIGDLLKRPALPGVFPGRHAFPIAIIVHKPAFKWN